MTTPTDEQIIEKLARFCGDGSYNAWCADGFGPSNRPEFLESHDALRPILERLSEYQQNRLIDKLYWQWPVNTRDLNIHALVRLFGRHALTLPPRTLALALYEVIGE